MMEIYFNEKQLTIPAGMTLHEFTIDKNIVQKKGIAILVNDDVISAADWHKRVLEENDRISLFGAIQGG